MFALFALLACGTAEVAGDGHDHDHAAEAKEGHDHAKKGGGHGHDHGAEGHEAHASAEPVAAKDGWAHYGDPFKMAAATDCKEIIAAPDTKVDQVVRVEGRIENVCQKAGCWMVVADDEGKYLRITMKDHGFGVPTDTKTGPDTRVDVEGKLIKKTLDEKTLAHLKSEAKGNPDELAEQFAPKYEIVATGVSVKQM